jgi:hypothetical protein
LSVFFNPLNDRRKTFARSHRPFLSLKRGQDPLPFRGSDFLSRIIFPLGFR